MADLDERISTRDRSPAFPFISLRQSLDRFSQYLKRFQLRPTLVNKAARAWNLEQSSSQTARILAALKYFGLIIYSGIGSDKKIIPTEDAISFINIKDENIKRQILMNFALKPKEIMKFWKLWGAERPSDEICIEQLITKESYNRNSVSLFLNVYDETVSFAGLKSYLSNKFNSSVSLHAYKVFQAYQVSQDLIYNTYINNTGMWNTHFRSYKPVVTNPWADSVVTSDIKSGERILDQGVLSDKSNFKILVNGKIGIEEIQIIIKKLEKEKEILANTYLSNV